MLHQARMRYALDFLHDMFPLNEASYIARTEEQISHTDQLIYRFSQLQDTLGGKLFPMIIRGLGENEEHLPFIDILNRLEKLEIIESTDRWLSLREVRNQVTHEYPENKLHSIEGLNELRSQSQYISTALDRVIEYMKERGWLQ
jgi:hypothetical protein